MDLDDHLSQVNFDVDVDFAPAYELTLALSCYLNFPGKSGLDLGQAWVHQVAQQLPPEAAARFSRKSAKIFKEHDCDLLALLVHVCPTDRDAAGFLAWFGQLSAGAAYELLAPLLPESAPRLPRDFVIWRDTTLDMLGLWHASYFRHIDRAILEALRREANGLRKRVKTVPPQQLVEEVTNGLVIEPSPQLRRVILVPQYHHRPYNHQSDTRDGTMLLYPFDALPTPADLPSPNLLRLTHALSDESRLRMLRFLADGPRSLTEVARFAGLSQPTVHHHLTQLRAAGLVRIHFSLSSPNRYSLRPHALEQLSAKLGDYLFSSTIQKETAGRHDDAVQPRNARAGQASGTAQRGHGGTAGEGGAAALAEVPREAGARALSAGDLARP